MDIIDSTIMKLSREGHLFNPQDNMKLYTRKYMKIQVKGIIAVNDDVIIGISDEGYPWKAYIPGNAATSLKNIHFFKNDDIADNYLNMFKGYTKKHVIITIEEVL